MQDVMPQRHLNLFCISYKLILALQSSPPSALIKSLLTHPHFRLNLLVKPRHTPHLHPRKHILPTTSRIPPTQNVLMHTPLCSTKHHRPPLSFPRNLQLHAATNRLCHPERPSQAFHLQRVLRGGPLCEPRLERVRTVEGDGGCACCCGERVCHGTDAGAEGVVDAGGGGGACGGGLEMAVGVGVGAGWCDSHCLLRCVSS